MSQGNLTAVQEARPIAPIICRRTGWYVGIPFLGLLLLGPFAGSTLGQPNLMAHPAMLFAFGILELSFAVSFLGWYRTWVSHLHERRRWRRRNRNSNAESRLTRKPRIRIAIAGIYCLAGGIALLVGAICQL